MNGAAEWTELEEALCYTFRNKELLETALTHSSYANEQPGGIESNERFEFLGDAVTGLEVALLLFEKEPQLSEGEMTTTRAALVNTEGLADLARGLNVGRWLKLGVGASKTEISENDAVLADAFEALIAAVFLDGGIWAVRSVVRKHFERMIEDRANALSGMGISADYKSQLQAVLQKHGAAKIYYEVEGESGPDHEKTFRVSVFSDGKKLGTGEGRTKKLAEKMAAKMALEESKCI